MKDDSANDPFDEELDDAVMLAAEIVSRVKRVGLDRLELPIRDESESWVLTVTKTGGSFKASANSTDGDGSNGRAAAER